MLPVAYVHGMTSPKATAIVNAASFDPSPIAPGSLVSIFGSQLSPREWKATTFPARPLQNWVTAIFSVGGQDRVANIVYESPNQLNVQVPTDLPQGFGQLKINNPTQSPNSTTPSTTIPIAVRGASPGIFTFGDNRAVVQNPNGRVNTPTEPARPGDVVVAYLTGQGPGDYPAPHRRTSSNESHHSHRLFIPRDAGRNSCRTPLHWTHARVRRTCAGQYPRPRSPSRRLSPSNRN